MNVLEKILEEIEEEIRDSIPFSEQRADGLRKARDIIRKHMSELSRENNQKNTRLPRDNDGWIKCEERSPEEAGRYIITALDGERKIVSFAKWQNRYKRFDMAGERAYWRVIAWQPLPEPYRPEKEKSSCKEHIMSRFMKVE